MPASASSTRPEVKTFIDSHAEDCRKRLRIALLSNTDSSATLVSKRMLMSQAEQRLVSFWHRAGFSRLDAIRLVCEPSMYRGRA